MGRVLSGLVTAVVALAAVVPALSGAAAPRPGIDWPQFRGIRAAGIDDRHPAPATWDVAKNAGVRWRTAVPGLGHASPVIWGDTLYLATSISSRKDTDLKVGLYGDIKPVDDDTPHEWRVYAIDKATGAVGGSGRSSSPSRRSSATPRRPTPTRRSRPTASASSPSSAPKGCTPST